MYMARLTWVPRPLRVHVFCVWVCVCARPCADSDAERCVLVFFFFCTAPGSSGGHVEAALMSDVTHVSLRNIEHSGDQNGMFIISIPPPLYLCVTLFLSLTRRLTAVNALGTSTHSVLFVLFMQRDVS